MSNEYPTTIFLHPLPLGDPMVRVVIPGIDDGGAVYLEATFSGRSREDVKKLVPLIAEKLRGVIVDNRD